MHVRVRVHECARACVCSPVLQGSIRISFSVQLHLMLLLNPTRLRTIRGLGCGVWPIPQNQTVCDLLRLVFYIPSAHLGGPDPSNSNIASETKDIGPQNSGGEIGGGGWTGGLGWGGARGGDGGGESGAGGGGVCSADLPKLPA